jgi:hypothetical protein
MRTGFVFDLWFINDIVNCANLLFTVTSSGLSSLERRRSSVRPTLVRDHRPNLIAQLTVLGTANTEIFTLRAEDHTIGNLLRDALIEMPEVTFAAYKVCPRSFYYDSSTNTRLDSSSPRQSRHHPRSSRPQVRHDSQRCFQDRLRGLHQEAPDLLAELQALVRSHQDEPGEPKQQHLDGLLLHDPQPDILTETSRE